MRAFHLHLLLLIAQASAFTTGTNKLTQHAILSDKDSPHSHEMVANPALFIRGGGEVISTLSSSLQSGPAGVLSLWAVATAVVAPLTLYRQGWSFSVGYGFSVMALGIAILNTFQTALSGASLYLVTAVIFYGARLGLYLLLRNFTVKSKREQMKKTDTTPRLQRLPMAASVALFYSFLATPVLYAARAAGGTTLAQPPYLQNISMAGAGIAWFGALLEALADGHKFISKVGWDQKSFVGPTGGVFRICRHPNYLGELIFWFGVLLGGAPSFGTKSVASIVPWVCSSLGLFGIYGIMTGATKRLDAKQKENYGGQGKYDTWRHSVTSAIFPFKTVA
mmetsp:Transcript_15338/g.18169  ORF Transcript_15338/g.18169 Transcript_15338/m.18169 type:complete len:336 (+) Transcript_15338:15-1022(+)